MVFGKMFGKRTAKPGNAAAPDQAAASRSAAPHASAPDGNRIVDIERFPWEGDPTASACNFALGHLCQNLAPRLTIDGKIHAETYVAAAGAIAGFAAQRTLFDRLRSQPDAKINVVETKAGNKYWFADDLNTMLVPLSEAESNTRVWSLAAGAATSAGLALDEMPDLNAMFAYVASSIGGETEGFPSVPAENRPHMTGRELLKIGWPVALTCFSGRFPGSDQEYGEAPRKWWSAIAAHATSRAIGDVKGVLAPAQALTILMETAIYCSKLDERSLAMP